MITLDMLKKNTTVRIEDHAFNLENNIVTLPIELLNYDIEGKTITAVFEPVKIETGALEVVDGVIQIPIYSSMVKAGVNYIQLNFRWENKLEQSPKMMWAISQSLETQSVAQEDFDIISYLIAQANSVVDEAGIVREELDASVESANKTKQTLDDTITDASTTKTNLEDTITNAEEVKGLIDNPETGAIKKATDSKAELENVINKAGTTKTNLEDTIGEGVVAKDNYAQLNKN